ncbi:MAG: DUF928 domain-containing protein [Synechococcales bacterium]|nr:DUF928 domain-containing protein [Synechococcales bacterium]
MFTSWNRPLTAFLVSGVLIASQTGLMNSAIAGYTPPKRKTPQRTDSTGTRSNGSVVCGNSSSAEKMFLSVLSPVGHTGETVSGRPTLFAFFTGKQSLAMRLLDAEQPKVLWSQTVKAEKPGFVAIPFPANQPELVAGKSYRWSVEVICNPKRPFENKGLIVTTLHRVAMPLGLRRSLIAVNTPSDRANLYIDNSLWYNAVEELGMASLSQPKNADLKKDLLMLLEEGGLTKTVNQERLLSQPPKAHSHCHSSPTGVGNSSMNVRRSDADRTRCP